MMREKGIKKTDDIVKLVNIYEIFCNNIFL